MKDFTEALEAYKDAKLLELRAEESYRLAYAKAVTESDGKNEAARKAAADTATSALRTTRDNLAVYAEVALHLVEFLKASAGRAA